MPKVKIGDIDMYYEIHGEGPSVFFISGTNGDLRRQPNVFDGPLNPHFEILGYDQRGMGQTDKPDIPYSMMDYAMDAKGLLNELGWNSCSVMGVSFGGMVAQELALLIGDRIERLVLACTSSGGKGGASYPLHEFDKLTPKERALRMIPLLDNRHDETWKTDRPQEFQQLVDQMVTMAQLGAEEPGRKEGSQRQLEARAGHNTYDRLPNIKIPVFICCGRYDGIAPVSNSEAIKEQIPNSQLEVFEGGHLFLAQDPKAYERVRQFLQ